MTITTNENKLYTSTELTKILSLSQRTIYNYIKSGKLKAYKIGRVWRIKQSDYNSFLIQKTNVN